MIFRDQFFYVIKFFSPPNANKTDEIDQAEDVDKGHTNTTRTESIF